MQTAPARERVLLKQRFCAATRSARYTAYPSRQRQSRCGRVALPCGFTVAERLRGANSTRRWSHAFEAAGAIVLGNTNTPES